MKMNKKVTFVELVELMAEASSTSKRVCELFLRELFSTISQALINGESVKVNGVGTFKLTQVKPRKSSKEKSDDSLTSVGSSKVSFTPDKKLAEAVNQPFAHFESVVLDDAMTDEKLAEVDEQHSSEILSHEADAPAQAPVDFPELADPAPSPEPEGFYVPPSFDEIASITEEIAAADVPAEEPEPEMTVMAAPEPEPEATVTAPDEQIAQRRIEELQRKPMLIGRPIDGPSRPVPKPEEEEESVVDSHFYRPEPRNAYRPTPEQIERASHKTDRRWIWIALAVLAVGSLIWWLARPSGKAEEPVQQAVVISDSDSVAVEVAEEDVPAKPSEPAKADDEVKPAKPAKAADAKVVTDVITQTEVLTTLAEKYYGSQWFWVYIYEENKSIISNPNNVKPGTRVVIPPAEKYGIDVNNPASLKKAQHRSWELLK